MAKTRNPDRSVKPTVKERLPIKSYDTDFPIVGIGASAGGLEALEEFFGNLPPDCGMAFVVIQHLDPDHAGAMPELLQRYTGMKVLQAGERMGVKPNHVYIIPPNKSMSLLKSSLHLFDPVESRGLRLPIDIFFRALANDRQEKSIGIILSGMGSDGSMGAKAIQEKSGLLLVQDPSTAKFNGMPQSALESVLPDIIASAGELPIRLIEHLKLNPEAQKPDLDIPLDINHLTNIDKIIILLREQTGHDFSLYKKKTLFRRIERRKGIHQINKIESYVRFLQENPQEIDILFKEILIGVTEFFRDSEVWKKLENQIFPDLMAELPNDYVFRVWVPGCSTGEEPYSIAILLMEVFEKIKKKKKITIQIFASDLDQDAIDKARQGLYPANITADISPERLKKYFIPETEGYRISKTIREMVVFAIQNMVKDPPFTRIQLVSCRNVLIYMENELQRNLIKLFNYSLNPGGILLLGISESIYNKNNEFQELDSKLKIYKRSSRPSLSAFTDLPYPPQHSRIMTTVKKELPRQVENLQVISEHFLFQNFTPASVLVNEKGDILYITGHTGKFIEPAAGKANWNIHAMAREGIRHILPDLFRRALKTFQPLTEQNIHIGVNDSDSFMDLTVQRIEGPEIIRGLIMVVFSEVRVIVKQGSEKQETGIHGSRGKEKKLEQELSRLRLELRSTREEMQTSQEELKSINEELQSANEELQSTNEELTTSKEETQSLNEELQTVNAELQSKVNDLLRINDDMKNLLNSTEIATLFLDKELKIRRFTDPVSKLFKLRNSDLGRPFTDQVSDLLYPEIEIEAYKVIKTLLALEKEVSTNDGKWFKVRIMPYRTRDDRIDGLVITFIDITTAKILEIKLKNANDSLLKLK
jgi:two-component system CheB/CheR fusion protein